MVFVWVTAHARGVLCAALCLAPLIGCAQTTVEGSVDKALPPGAQPAVVAGSESLAPEAQTTAAPLAACRPDSMPTQTPAVLTVGASALPQAPWFTEADPTTGAGLEAAIVGHTAKVLGFGSVTWVGPDDPADLYVGQFTAEDIGDAPGPSTSPSDASSISTGYFAIHDTAVVRSADAGRTPSIQWESGRVGYVPGAASELTVTERQARNPQAFPTEAAGLAALRSGQLDAMLIPITSAVDLQPTDELVAAAQIPPLGARQSEQFVMTLPPASTLTPCIDAALDRLRIEGVLAAEARRWVTVPVTP